MRVELEGLGAAPKEYEQLYFSNMVRAIEAAMRRIDYAPVYDPEAQRTDSANPSKALYSTGGIKLDEAFVPESAEDIIPKKYVDAIDAALQEALATLDAARQAAEASLLAAVTAAQEDIDAVKGDASLITFNDATSVLSSTDVQDAIDEVAGDTGASGNVSYDPSVSILTETDVAAALDEVAGVSATTTGVIGVDTVDYPTGNNLAGVLADIDSRLTTLEP